jgi:Carboxypeptidase regulatory-like domain
MKTLVPCSQCHRHVRVTEDGCPFCRAPRSSALVGAIMGLAVGCGTPAPRTQMVRELPIQAPDAGAPDAPPDAAPVVVDAAVDAPPAPPAQGKGKISGRVFSKVGANTVYYDVGLQLISSDRTVIRYAGTNSAQQGAYELQDLPPGTYKLHISDNTQDADAELDVVVGRDQSVKLDIDLARIAMRLRPAKPYGAPPARRRLV